MKIYKYITLALIFALSAFCGYECLTSLSVDSTVYFILTLCCAFFVLLNKETPKNKKRAQNAKV